MSVHVSSYFSLCSLLMSNIFYIMQLIPANKNVFMYFFEIRKTANLILAVFSQ